MAPPEFIVFIAAVLREMPAPTQSWADIIGHIAGPAVVLFLIIRFRIFLRTILQTITDRLVTDDVKLGPFELTNNSEVLVLDADEVDPDSEFTSDDVTHIEALFEFIGEKGNEARIARWLNENGLQTLDVVDFLTEAIYADERAKAYDALILTGGHGEKIFRERIAQGCCGHQKSLRRQKRGNSHESPNGRNGDGCCGNNRGWNKQP